MDNAMHWQHPKDRQQLGALLECGAVEQLFQWCRENQLDSAAVYAYRASCAEITRETCPAVYEMILRACAFFGDVTPPLCFVSRSYEEKIELTGIFTPILLISDAYLADADPGCLYGTIAGQIAAIALGHQKGIGLSWIFRYCAGLLPIPGAALTAVEALLNRWSRCRWFSCDRGCLLATGNYETAMKTLLDFQIPGGILRRLHLGQPEDGYRPQTEQFFSASTAGSMATMLHSLQSDTTWIPERYRELRLFQERAASEEGGDAL